MKKLWTRCRSLKKIKNKTRHTHDRVFITHRQKWINRKNGGKHRTYKNKNINAISQRNTNRVI